MTTQTIRIESISLDWAQKIAGRLAEIGFDVEYSERWDSSHRIAAVRATREAGTNA